MKLSRIFAALAVLLALAAPAAAQQFPMGVTGNTQVPSYSAGVVSLANAVAGDLYCITGSATKTVSVKVIRISAIATAAIAQPISLIKRSTADTGGTSAAVTLVPNNSANAAGTATITSYTAAPTPGTPVGTVRAQNLAITTTAAPSGTPPAFFQFSEYWDQPIVLHGTLENVCVNTPGANAGASWNIDSEHTEQ
jgi:hypothetical protein